MSLANSKVTRINIKLNWAPTIDDIENLFDREGAAKIIEKKLLTSEVMAYFEKRLVENFKEFLTEDFCEKDRKDMLWLLNQKALLRDVKVNTEISLLKKVLAVDQIERASEELSNDDIFDIIYNIEEELDDIINDVLSEPFLISNKRRQDESNNNQVRDNVVLLPT